MGRRCKEFYISEISIPVTDDLSGVTHYNISFAITYEDTMFLCDRDITITTAYVSRNKYLINCKDSLGTNESQFILHRNIVQLKRDNQPRVVLNELECLTSIGFNVVAAKIMFADRVNLTFRKWGNLFIPDINEKDYPNVYDIFNKISEEKSLDYFKSNYKKDSNDLTSPLNFLKEHFTKDEIDVLRKFADIFKTLDAGN